MASPSLGRAPTVSQKSLRHSLPPSLLSLVLTPKLVHYSTEPVSPDLSACALSASRPATAPLGPSSPTSPQDLPPPPPSPNQPAFVAASCCALGMAGRTGTGQPYKTRSSSVIITKQLENHGETLGGTHRRRQCSQAARQVTHNSCSFQVPPSWECHHILIPAFLCKTSPLSQLLSPRNKGILARLGLSCL